MKKIDTKLNNHNINTESEVSQRMILLKHLKKKSITSMEAISLYGITRLASRIWDLKQLGFNIQDEWCLDYNRYGQKIKYKKYKLVKGA